MTASAVPWGPAGAASSTSEPPLDATFHLAAELMAVGTLDGHLLAVNRSWTEVLGWDTATLRSWTVIDLVHPDDRSTLGPLVAALQAGELVRDLEHRLRHRDGSYRWIRWRAVVDPGDGLVRVAGLDVTEERMDHSALEQLEGASRVGYWELDIGTGRTSWSRATHLVYGTEPGRFDPSVEDGLAFYPPEAQAVLVPAFQELLSRGTAYDLELPFRRADGEPRLIRTTGRAVLRGDLVIRAFGTIQDVTLVAREAERLRHFEQLVELTGEGIVEADRDGVITYANAQLGELMGRPAEELVGASVFPLLCEEPDGCSMADMATGRGCRSLKRRQLQLPRGDGRFWAQVSVRLVCDEHGAPQLLTAVVTDIDDQKTRELELLTLQGQLDQAHQLAGLGHWRADMTAGSVYWSPTVAAILGVEPRDTVGVGDYLERVHPDDLAQLQVTIADLRRSPVYDLAHRIVRPDGEVRRVHLLADLMVDRDGHEVLNGTLRDVTELERTQQALRHSEDRMRRVLAATNDGWWDADLVTGELYLSERWKEIHGYLDGLPQDALEARGTLFDPDHADQVTAVVADTMAVGGRTFTTEAAARHRDGHLIPLMIRGLIDYDDDGVPVRVSGASTDISAAKEAEAAKERFVSTVSHELRTPLTGIGGALELLSVGTADADPYQREVLLDLAMRNTVRLRTLIDDLLDVEQLRTAGLESVPVLQPLAPLVRQAVADQDATAALREVRLVVDDPGRDVEVRVDGRRIGQVLTNLVSNALKFAPPGTEVHVVIGAPSDAEVEVSVTDRGPGVPAAFANRIFQRFAQADPSHATSRGGTGLGLAICKHIVELHGGRIGYRVADGTTRFWFTLPRGRPEASGV